MNKLKLALGQSVTMDVVSVTEVPSRFGAEVRFSGRTDADADTSIFLKVATADRQLARLSLTRESAANRRLVFTKTPENFIDIDHPVAAPPSVAPVMSAPAAPAVAPASNAEKRTEWDKLVRTYRRCYAEARAISTESTDYGITDVGVATIADSLFTAVLQKGLLA